MATKYKQYVEKMLDAHGDLFDEFQKIHDLYALDEDKHQSEFNRVGSEVMRVIREFEQKLCSTQEKTYNQFTSKLADKFQEEIRKTFPMIDYVGIVSTTPEVAVEPAFAIKKISL